MIALVMFTHDDPPERVDYAWRTLHGLKLLSSKEAIWFHLADDGSSQQFRDEIMEDARKHWGKNTSVSNSEGRGYGANYNIASQRTNQVADLIVPVEDDWEVQRAFDLDPFAKVLRDGHFECIRMGYIGYTDTLRATFKWYDKRHYLALDADSPEKHIFAGGPRIETVSFERRVGAWPTDLGAGATELEVASRKEARQGIAWPVTDIKPAGDLFFHIGTKQSVTGNAGSNSEMHEKSS